MMSKETCLLIWGSPQFEEASIIINVFVEFL